MDVATLLVAVLALVVAVLALQRARRAERQLARLLAHREDVLVLTDRVDAGPAVTEPWPAAPSPASPVRQRFRLSDRQRELVPLVALAAIGTAALSLGPLAALVALVGCGLALVAAGLAARGAGAPAAAAGFTALWLAAAWSGLEGSGEVALGLSVLALLAARRTGPYLVLWAVVAATLVPSIWFEPSGWTTFGVATGVAVVARGLAGRGIGPWPWRVAAFAVGMHAATWFATEDTTLPFALGVFATMLLAVLPGRGSDRVTTAAALLLGAPLAALAAHAVGPGTIEGWLFVAGSLLALLAVRFRRAPGWVLWPTALAVLSWMTEVDHPGLFLGAVSAAVLLAGFGRASPGRDALIPLGALLPPMGLALLAATVPGFPWTEVAGVLVLVHVTIAVWSRAHAPWMEAALVLTLAGVLPMYLQGGMLTLALALLAASATGLARSASRGPLAVVAGLVTVAVVVRLTGNPWLVGYELGDRPVLNGWLSLYGGTTAILALAATGAAPGSRIRSLFKAAAWTLGVVGLAVVLRHASHGLAFLARAPATPFELGVMATVLLAAAARLSRDALTGEPAARLLWPPFAVVGAGILAVAHTVWSPWRGAEGWGLPPVDDVLLLFVMPAVAFGLLASEAKGRWHARPAFAAAWALMAAGGSVWALKADGLTPTMFLTAGVGWPSVLLYVGPLTALTLAWAWLARRRRSDVVEPAVDVAEPVVGRLET